MSRAPTPSGVLVLPRSASRADWLAARRRGITATDVVAIVGLSKFATALDVYVDKRVGSQDSGREDAGWGQLLEDVVAREWAARGGHRIRRVGLLANRDAPHHLASCDRLIIIGPREAAGVLEVKTTSARSGPAWETSPPERVAVQVQWQLHVTGLEMAHVAVLVGGQELRDFMVARDQDLIDYLIGEADRVWGEVQAGVLPDAGVSVAALDRLHPTRSGAVDVPAGEAGRWVDAYRAARDAEKAAAVEKEAARAQLVALLGDAQEATVDGGPGWSYRHGRPGLAMPAPAVRRFAAEHPDLADEYLTTRPGLATFRLAADDEED